jgi:cytochrome oxidase Cu insertion factor (SCO1/SenC/PrrC family)
MTEPVKGAALTRQRLSLVFLVALFLVPVLGAWLMFKYINVAGPGATTNNGDLVIPARPLRNVSLQSAEGGSLGTEFFRGKWTLVLLVPERCDQFCEQNLFYTRQAHVLLNKDMKRFQRLFVTRQPLPEARRNSLRKQHPMLNIAWADGVQWRQFAEQFPEVRPQDEREGPPFYLVDPLGNVMMEYDSSVPPKGMLKDWQRLLKISQVG